MAKAATTAPKRKVRRKKPARRKLNTPEPKAKKTRAKKARSGDGIERAKANIAKAYEDLGRAVASGKGKVKAARRRRRQAK